MKVQLAVERKCFLNALQSHSVAVAGKLLKYAN